MVLSVLEYIGLLQTALLFILSDNWALMDLMSINI
jgi:hypothetical protein